MTLIRPFAGLRVRADAAARVSSPPYDVMNSEEAARMAAGNPDSFLHVSRPEIDLPSGTDVHADAVYAQAAKALVDLEQRGLLLREAAPHLYLYRLTMDGRRQTGIAAAFSVDAYREGRIKRHEFTRPDKEDDRTRHVDTTSANSGPVFLAFRADAELKARLRAIEVQPPVIDITTDDGIRHELWPVGEDGEIAALVAGVERAGALYIADGHHRCAAAGRVADLRRERNPGYTGDEPFNFGYAVCFPHDELRIFDYNRFVRDLAGRTPEAFLAEIGGAFDVAPAGAAVRPARRGEFGMHLGGRWYRLTVKPALVPVGDPVRSLDVSVLQDNLLGPVLGIADPRRDARIDFVGGIRGLGELERRVADVPGSVAFSMYPTSLEEVMAVADAGEVMPPKSTWFEPKLRDGLLVQTI